MKDRWSDTGILKTVVLVVTTLISLTLLYRFVQFAQDPLRSGATSALMTSLGVGLVLNCVIIGICSAFGYPPLDKLWRKIVVAGLIGGVLAGLMPQIVDAVQQGTSGTSALPLRSRVIYLDTTPIKQGFHKNQVALKPLTGGYPSDMNGLAAIIIVDNPGTDPSGEFHIEIVGSVHTRDLPSFGSYGSSESGRKFTGYLGESYYKERYTDTGKQWMLDTIASIEPDYKNKFVALYTWDSQFRVLDKSAVVSTLIVLDLEGNRFSKHDTQFTGEWGKVGSARKFPTVDEIRRGITQEGAEAKEKNGSEKALPDSPQKPDQASDLAP